MATYTLEDATSWRRSSRGLGSAVSLALIAGLLSMAGIAPALAQAVPEATTSRVSIAPRAMQTITPGLATYTDNVLFGDVWLRPDLTPRDRSLITLSVLIATGKTAQLSGHLGRALDNGLKPSEIAGIVTHLAFYTGWPNAVSFLDVIEQVFAARKVDLASLRQPTEHLPATTRGSAQTLEPDVTRVAPKLAQLTESILFDDLWRRDDLIPRDRNLVTIAVLATVGDSDQFAVAIERGLKNGLTQAQVSETLAHLAFYAGWPKALAAARVAGKTFTRQGAAVASAASPAIQVFAPGTSPAHAPSTSFTGSATITSHFEETGTDAGGATVTFEPGARTNWHTHPGGQLLIVTAGAGWVQAAGEPVRLIKMGDVVWIAPGVRHWHGATRASGMTHVAISKSIDGKTVTWLEPVADRDYQAASDRKD